MNLDPGACVRVLDQADALPSDHLASFVVGSAARGWANSASDIDVVVVTREQVVDERALLLSVPLVPNAVPTVAFYDAGRRWEVKFWQADQVDQLFAKVTWAAFENERRLGQRLSTVEELFLERVHTCLPLSGTEWIADQQDTLSQSAFRSMIAVRALTESDAAAETAMGQLGGGDIGGAVLSARDAFGWAVDALSVSCGEYGSLLKWRPRRVRLIDSDVLTFEDYWSIETMRTYDAARPEVWVDEVVQRCKRVTMDIEL